MHWIRWFHVFMGPSSQEARDPCVDNNNRKIRSMHTHSILSISFDHLKSTLEHFFRAFVSIRTLKIHRENNCLGGQRSVFVSLCFSLSRSFILWKNFFFCFPLPMVGSCDFSDSTINRSVLDVCVCVSRNLTFSHLSHTLEVAGFGVWTIDKGRVFY